MTARCGALLGGGRARVSERRPFRQLVALVLERNDYLPRAVDIAPSTTTLLEVLVADRVPATAVADHGEAANKGKCEVPGRGNHFGQAPIDRPAILGAKTSGPSSKKGEKYQWIIECDDHPAGWITLVVTNWEHGLAEIGYALSTPYQSRGIMPIALGLLVRELFATTEIVRKDALIEFTGSYCNDPNLVFSGSLDDTAVVHIEPHDRVGRQAGGQGRIGEFACAQW